MNDLLANPAVQAAAAPFVLALVLAAGLHRTRLLVLAIAAAFVLAVGLTVGFSFEPLTATRKLVLAAIGAAIVATTLEIAGVSPSARLNAILAAAGAATSVWIAWRVLQQQDAPRLGIWAAGTAGYTALLIASGLRVGTDTIRACATSLVLGLTVAGLALLGASALLTQFGIAIAAGAGAALLIQMVTSRRAPSGWTLALPASVVVAGIGVLSVLTGQLPWFCLVPMLAIPWATRLVRTDGRPLWLISFLTALVAAVPMLLAVAIAWFTAAAST
jgi:hypothetical protein